MDNANKQMPEVEVNISGKNKKGKLIEGQKLRDIWQDYLKSSSYDFMQYLTKNRYIIAQLDKK